MDARVGVGPFRTRASSAKAKANMRPFVHWTLAWTACFAVMFTLMAATALVQGQLDAHWRSFPGAVEGVVLLVVMSLVSGAAIAAIGAFFDWLGWRDPQERPVKNPIVRTALLPAVLYALILLWWALKHYAETN
jgi:hypothetical protein